MIIANNRFLWQFLNLYDTCLRRGRQRAAAAAQDGRARGLNGVRRIRVAERRANAEFERRAEIARQNRIDVVQHRAPGGHIAGRERALGGFAQQKKDVVDRRRGRLEGARRITENE